jgi:large subunit ribosomal protein L23
MTALFGKPKKDKEVKAKDKTKTKAKEKAVEPKKIQAEEIAETEEKEKPVSSVFVTGGASAYRVLKGFYVSEKSSMGSAHNQYVFRVFKRANKAEVKKEVSKLFNVQIKSVKMLNMPEKRRDFGKHPGERSGFKKAIVVLKEGFVIGQAKT